jgi:hypothetical protein
MSKLRAVARMHFLKNLFRAYLMKKKTTTDSNALVENCRRTDHERTRYLVPDSTLAKVFIISRVTHV